MAQGQARPPQRSSNGAGLAATALAGPGLAALAQPQWGWPGSHRQLVSAGSWFSIPCVTTGGSTPGSHFLRGTMVLAAALATRALQRAAPSAMLQEPRSIACAFNGSSCSSRPAGSRHWRRTTPSVRERSVERGSPRDETPWRRLPLEPNRGMREKKDSPSAGGRRGDVVRSLTSLGRTKGS